MNPEYSDLQRAQEAAKGLGENTKTLAGIAVRRVTGTVKDLYGQLTTPLSLQEQAKRTVLSKERREVKRETGKQAAQRLASAVAEHTLDRALSWTRGAAQGFVGWIDDTTKALAAQKPQGPPPREAGDIGPSSDSPSENQPSVNDDDDPSNEDNHH